MSDTSIEDFDRRQREKWNGVAPDWYDSAPPAIPSKQDLAVFESFVSLVVPTVRGAILGCTPGLRVLSRSQVGSDGQVFLLDMVPAMYASATARIGISVSRTEYFLLSNWLAIPLATGCLDFVLGDKSLDNVHPRFWPELFGELARVLRVGGCLCLHVGLTPPNFQPDSPAKALTKWGALLVNQGTDLKGAAAGFWEDLLTSSGRDGKEETLTVRRWEMEMERLRMGILNRSEREILASYDATFGASTDGEWANVTLERLEIAQRFDLSLAGESAAEDYPNSGDQPILCFERVSSARTL